MSPILLYIHGAIRDVSEFANIHPGGLEILKRCMKMDDSTNEYDKFGHSDEAWALMESMKVETVNTLTTPSSVPINSKRPPNSFMSRIRKKLFTHEDYRNVHKVLGLVSLLHILPRCIIGIIYRKDYFELWFGPVIRTLLVCVQILLSLTSLQFQVPKGSNVLKPMIHSMFRAHSICFALRTAVCTLFMIWPTKYSTVLRVFFCILAMVCADEITSRLTIENDSYLTTRAMPYWPGISPSRLKLHKFFYTTAQFAATIVCMGTTSELLVLSTIIPIQGAAFLMTLVRKSIIVPHTYHLIYTLMLALPYMLADSLPKLLFLLVTIGITYVLRVKYYMDKYMLWVCTSSIIIACRVPIFNPVYMYLIWALCVYGFLSRVNPKAQGSVDPNSRVFSNVHTGKTHTRLILRTRDKILNFKPGQFVTISDGAISRKYTPLTIVPVNQGTQSMLELAIRRYDDISKLTFSAYLYSLSSEQTVLVDGPFGTKYYDETQRVLFNDAQQDTFVPGKDTIVLLSGGSGVSPMYSLAVSMLASGLHVRLITLDTSEQTAMLRNECVDLQARYKRRLQWTRHVTANGSRLIESNLRDYTSEARKVCVCGPPGLISFIRAFLPSSTPLIVW